MDTGILSEIAYNDGYFPREALQRIIDRKDEVIPELLETMAYTCEHAEELARKEDYMAHLYAIYLLAQFRVTDAYPLIYSLLTKPSGVLEDLLGDTISEGLPQILASVCGGNTGLIKRLIENPEIYEYVRGSAIESLVILVAREIMPRREIVEYFQDLFRDKLERRCSVAWADLVVCSCDLYPEELIDDIERAYDGELVEPIFMSLDDARDRLQKTSGVVLEKLKSDPQYRLIDDVIAEMGWWACYDKEDRPKREIDRSAMSDVVGAPEEIPEPRRVGTKIGRNDPCPCGSGKKYKKCCGRDA
jgi:hypothetical protein